MVRSMYAMFALTAALFLHITQFAAIKRIKNVLTHFDAYIISIPVAQCNALI